MSRVSVSSIQVVNEFNNISKEVQQKLLGMDEFIRMYKHTCQLTDAAKHCIDVVAAEYKMTLIPLK